MLKKLLYLFLVCVSAASCLKSKEDTGCPYQPSSVVAPAAEKDSLQAYLDSNNIQATLHPSGFYYEIVDPGTGTDSASLCSQIVINYKGQLTNGNVFDEQDNVLFVLGSLIEGWKKAIPMIKKGGKIKLYIPPTLGYGNTDVKNPNTGQVVIPARSILIFDVDLLNFSVEN